MFRPPYEPFDYTALSSITNMYCEDEVVLVKPMLNASIQHEMCGRSASHHMFH